MEMYVIANHVMKVQILSQAKFMQVDMMEMVDILDSKFNA
jgi:hypothetical protein